MPVSYTVAIDSNDDGTFNQNISQDVIDLWWRLGMQNPYDSLAAPIQARITLRNQNQDYSPEETTLLPGKSVRIQSNDGTTTRTHFTGFIQHIEPQTGDQGSKQALLHLHGPESWLHENHVRVQPLQNATADTVIEAILNQALLRRPILDDYMVVGISGYNTIGTNKLFGENITRSLETGKSTFAYIGDTWGAGIRADEAIRQVAASERGRFFINRAGEAVFYNRHHTLTNTTLSATFEDDMAGLDYAYGADLVNQVSLTLTPRSIGTPNSVLWALSSTQRIAPNETRQFIARYRDDNDNPFGALSVNTITDYSANSLSDGSGVNQTTSVEVVLVSTDASAALVEIRNRSDNTVYMTNLTLHGIPLIGDDPLIIEQRNDESITFYGLGMLELDLPALTSINEADQLARYEIARRKVPRGRIRELRTNIRHHPTQTLARTLFDRIRIIESQTSHDSEYFIIAEEHRVSQGGTRHEVSWTLEVADSDHFVIVGTSKPNGERVLAY